MSKAVKVIETDYASDSKLKVTDSINFIEDADGQEWGVINVYDEIEYQSVLGFGGAITEATAINLARLDVDKRRKVLELYFDKEKGIGYNFCRSTINSCDFSTDFYSYDDISGDFELNNFDISHDKETVIPAIKAAKEMEPDLKLFCSPWSPPAWMKTNENMAKGGKLKKECWDVWARYVAEFILQYRNEGIDVWGVTVQNEAKAVQGWESCVYTASDERDFVTGYLRPTFERAGLGDKKIFFWDHNKERVVDRSLETLCNERSRAAFDGVAVHWYSGEHFSALDITHTLFPEKYIISSEQCTSKGTKPYHSGEKYAHDIIGNLNNWANAWVDWNMLLDDDGGPDHWKDEQKASGWKEEDIWVGESPIVYDTKTDSLDMRSSYYYMGHFSKFIERDAKRIGCSTFDSEIECCAFKNPNGTKVFVALNRTDNDKSASLRYKGELAKFELKAHSIKTFVF